MAPNRQLAAWIAKAGISNAEAARRVGYDRSNFHRIITGEAKPTIALAHSIEVLTGGDVAMSEWVGFEVRRPAPSAERAA